jgi:hypothetical protein
MVIIYQAEYISGPGTRIVYDTTPYFTPLPKPVITLTIFEANIKSDRNAYKAKGLKWNIYMLPAQKKITTKDKHGPKSEKQEVFPGISHNNSPTYISFYVHINSIKNIQDKVERLLFYQIPSGNSGRSHIISDRFPKLWSAPLLPR